MEIAIPHAIQAEHRQLHAELAQVMTLGGKTEQAAQAVEAVLRPHFLAEEEFAMPPLGALRATAANENVDEAPRIIELSSRLRAELPRMLEEHRAIVNALAALEQAAEDERRPQGLAFAVKLRAHAQMEEEVLYPAAMVVGDYLGLRGVR
jgi:Hemerythrin HHE cation binding domain